MIRILFLTLILSSHYSFAQSVKSSEANPSSSDFTLSQFEADLGKYDDAKHFMGNDKKHYWLFLKQSGNISKTFLAITDSNMQVVSTKVYDDKCFGLSDKNTDFVIESENKITFYYKDKIEKKSVLNTFILDKFTNEFSVSTALTIPSKEEYICGLSNKNRNLFITRSTKADSLYVYEFFSNKSFEKHGINCAEHGILKFKEIFKDISIQNNDEQIPLYDVVDKHKAFLNDTHIIFMRDNDDASEMPYCDLLKIDINNWKSTHDIHYFKFPDNTLKAYNIGAFIKDSFAFFSWASKKNYNLTIYQMPTWKLIKTYEFDAKGQISFRNSPIWRDETNNATLFTETSNDVNEIESVKKLLKNLVTGKLGIAVNKRNQQYHLTIGVVDPVQYTGAPMAIGPLGGALRMTVTLGGKPADLLMYEFKSVLDQKSLEHMKDIQLPIATDFQKFVKNVEVNPKTDLLSRFRLDERDYLGYFDKNSNKYIITSDKNSK